jgi:hypothetical protein
MRPGPRALFPQDMGAVVAREVLDALLVLGQACNDAGLAVLDAQSQFAQAAEGLWRCWDHTNIGDALGRVTEDRFAACRDHVERLTAVYAWAAAQYATCAVQAASRVADGEPASVPSLAVLPSDVLLLSQIHVPLLQIPDRSASGRWRSRVPRENVALAADHKRLIAAMKSVESPSVTFDEPSRVAERQDAYLLEAEFPAALHEYAASCVFALAMMSVPDT